VSSTNVQRPSPPRRRLTIQLNPLELVLIAGLAGVFLVNAAVALFEPSDVTGLVERSFIGRLFPSMNGRWVAWAVVVNDVAIAVALLATNWSPRARPVVLAWAGTWLLAVSLIKLTSLEPFGG
jgi:hypothetical protein